MVRLWQSTPLAKGDTEPRSSQLGGFRVYKGRPHGPQTSRDFVPCRFLDAGRRGKRRLS